MHKAFRQLQKDVINQSNWCLFCGYFTFRIDPQKGKVSFASQMNSVCDICYREIVLPAQEKAEKAKGVECDKSNSTIGNTEISSQTVGAELPTSTIPQVCSAVENSPLALFAEPTGQS